MIRKAQNRDTPRLIGEYHHVFPTVVFGKNNFTVLLSYREHRLAHILLYKIFEKRYGLSDSRTRKLLSAVIRMKYDKNGKFISPGSYELAKKYWSRCQKLEPSFKGKKHSKQTKQKISAKKQGQKLNITEEERHKKSIRAKKNYKNCLGRQDVREKMSISVSQRNKEKVWSEKERQKISNRLRQKHRSGEIQPHNKIPNPSNSKLEKLIEHDKQTNRLTKINKIVREAFGVSEPTASRFLKDYYTS